MSTAEPPDPATALTPAEFRQRMKALRSWAGRPSLRQLEQLGGVTRSAGGHRIKALPASTMSYVLSGRSGAWLPRLRFVEHYVASCLAASVQPVAAIEQFHHALATFRELDDRPAEGICLNNLGDALRRLGDATQAVVHLRNALALQRRTNDRAGQRFTLHSLADLHRTQQDYDRAVRYYRQTHALSQELGDQWGSARALDHLGSTLDTMGHTEPARECWRQSAAEFAALGRPEANEILARLPPAGS